MRVVIEGSEAPVAVEVKVGGRGLAVGRISSPAPAERAGRGETVYGVPFGECQSHVATLPGLARAELARAVELQTAYHLPFELSDAYAVCRQRTEGGATLLHILGIPIAHRAGAAAVVPLPMALAALGERQGLLGGDAAVLLVWQDGVSMMSVMMLGREAVFARAFEAHGDVAAALRMSAQAVYLRTARATIDVDRVVVFGDARDHAEAIADRFGAPVQHCGLAGVMPRADAARLTSELGEPAAVLVAGLALAPRSRAAGDWNLAARSRSWRSRFELAVRVAAIVLPILLPAVLWALTSANQAEIRGFEAEIEAVIDDYREVRRIGTGVERLESLLAGPARELASPRAWQQTLAALEQARPEGLWLSQVSGETGQQLQVAGSARYFDLVIEYLQALQASAAMRDVRLASTSSSDDGVGFQLTMIMNADGLPEEEP